MNPYDILRLPSNATDLEIKSAYRNLVKQFHPDRNRSEDAHQRIAEINQAYEILSDPGKRSYYDNPFQYLVSPITEQPEDPVEVYKREFKRKRWEEDRAEKIRKDETRAKTHHVLRIITIPILVFAVVLIVDKWLPKSQIEEAAYSGYQKESAREKTVLSFMQTRNFVVQVPNELYLSYPYHEADKPLLKIFYTPVLKVPTTIAITMGSKLTEIEVPNDDDSQEQQMRWMLLFSCILTLVRKKYTDQTYSLTFAPLIMLAIVLLMLLG